MRCIIIKISIFMVEKTEVEMRGSIDRTTEQLMLTSRQVATRQEAVRSLCEVISLPSPFRENNTYRGRYCF